MRGFVRAGAASDAVYDNARAFLTSGVSERWNPDGNIVLLADDAPPSATLLDPATVRITAKAAGTVDGEGRYTAARPGSTVTRDLRPHDRRRRVADQRAARGLRPLDRAAAT